MRGSSVDALATLVTVTGLLWLGREGSRSLGFQRECLGRQVLVGVCAGVAILLLDIVVHSTLATLFP